MGAFWAILAVPDHILSGRRAVLLGRMYLLDNGPRGCTASAAILGQYTGLADRTVEKYRGELADYGLVYRVTGTRGWHVNLPSGLPPDRANDAQILAYMRQIVDAIGPAESTPTGAVPSEKVRLVGKEVRPAVGESTPVGVAKYAPHRTDSEAESTPTGGESVATTITTPTTGLMSTQETHKGTHESDASHLLETHENGNGGIPAGDGKAAVRELMDSLVGTFAPNPDREAENRKKWAAVRGAA
jgi:hypothetical protein